jgi:hypothetical protein
MRRTRPVDGLLRRHLHFRGTLWLMLVPCFCGVANAWIIKNLLGSYRLKAELPAHQNVVLKAVKKSTIDKPIKAEQSRRKKTQNAKLKRQETPNIEPSGLSIPITETTFATALAIVPPDEAWDSLQRARHFARDDSFLKWPPAIRLFHPFCSRSSIRNVALELAMFLEDAQMEAFNIRLSKWTILPDQEAIQADITAQQLSTPSMCVESPFQKLKSERERELKANIDALIQSEEDLGQASKQRRDLVKMQKSQRDANGLAKNEVNMSANTNMDSTNNVSLKASDSSPILRDTSLPVTVTPNDFLIKQQQMYEEFNGPCVICLEPDKESAEKLRDLREFLRPLLFNSGDDYYSPTSSVGVTSYKLFKSEEYRPLVPIGAFSTVSAAIETARKLKSFFGAPLEFKVTDLQIISCDNANDPQIEPLTSPSWLSRSQDEEQNLQRGEEYGRDAMVMLVGEETEDDSTEEMAVLSSQKEEKCNGDYSLVENDDADEECNVKNETWNRVIASDLNVSALEQWLDAGDEDFEEGSVVAIGRTRFYTGENRIYLGMPATSNMDGQDRSLGASLSGAARRKHAVHQNQRFWSEASWGKTESTNLPPPKRAPRRKKGTE